jgi:epoxyqueuosine reductase QueG
MSLEDELIEELTQHGADFVHFISVTHLSANQNRNLPNAILFGIALTPEYLQMVTLNPDYVQEMIKDNRVDEDEFDNMEKKTDRIADSIARFLTEKGYVAYSQSENNIISTGHYDEQGKSTPLPHKTIAGIGGLGWIGKHNLLVTPEFGSAISMCTVLTDAPIKGTFFEPPLPECGNCTICVDICPEKVIKGKEWEPGIPRDEIVDVYHCTTCLNCMVLCPWTQAFIEQNLK